MGKLATHEAVAFSNVKQAPRRIVVKVDDWLTVRGTLDLQKGVKQDTAPEDVPMRRVLFGEATLMSARERRLDRPQDRGARLPLNHPVELI